MQASWSDQDKMRMWICDFKFIISSTLDFQNLEFYVLHEWRLAKNFYFLLGVKKMPLKWLYLQHSISHSYQVNIYKKEKL